MAKGPTPSLLQQQTLEALQERLGYRFTQLALLQQALTHRSFSADHNERLEFLGDSVLNLAVSGMLYRALHDQPEGDLSRVRANLVKQDTLHKLALELGLAGLVKLGEGEMRSGGQHRPSILADALEAVIGAVYLDAGYEKAQALVLRLLLWPFSLLFAALATLRRLAYQRGIFNTTRLPVPVVVVGNLSVGGTGKTPLTIALAEQLRRRGRHPGIVSRGYGGSARAPQAVDARSDPDQVGDEPVLLARRAGCPVWVGADRVAAARALLDRLALRTLSMGMTDDLEVAVEEGSTQVRVGSALFGERPRPAGAVR